MAGRRGPLAGMTVQGTYALMIRVKVRWVASGRIQTQIQRAETESRHAQQREEQNETTGSVSFIGTSASILKRRSTE